MADENLEGLEGLDDFGDDFGDQLDTFMEGDEEEGDSELDSFFEDLSTIDDLEMKEEETSEPEASTEEPPAEEPKEAAEEPEEAATEPEEAATEPEEAPAAAAAAPAAEEKPAEKKKEEKKPAKAAKPKKEKKSGPRKPILIAALITSVIGMVLGAITVGILYFLNMPEGVPEELAEQPEEPPAPVAAFKEPEPEPKPTSEPVAKTEPKPAVKKSAKPKSKPKSKPKPVTIPKGTRYYVQVANCVFDDCVQDYRSLLKKHGYKSRVVKNSDTSFLAEVISSQPLKDEASTKLVNRINRSNREAGQAYRKKTEKGYMVSLGLFPNLETAGRVRNFLNQAYGKETFFDIRRGEDKISYQQVQAGGYRTKKQAESLRKLLGRKDKNFEDAFIVAVKR
ncbi:MAG: SPOR domain-containing protein [SAR324 cluster bacterium]|nr:SPOR domain-containing protein [SAR324 cluster bacterium]